MVLIGLIATIKVYFLQINAKNSDIMKMNVLFTTLKYVHNNSKQKYMKSYLQLRYNSKLLSHR